MTPQAMDFEARVVAAVDRLLAEFRERLSAVGLRLEFRGILPEGEMPGSSEGRIGVYEGGEWIDSIEFFTLRDGNPAATVTEIEDWLTEELERLIADHPWGGGWEEA